jgi:hypothetical protein
MATGNTPPTDWYSELLQQLGFPDTPQNRAFLFAWHNHEQSAFGTWNPLSTTQRVSGSKSGNSAGVQIYPSRNAGIQATAITLLNGNYPEIIRGLKTGDIYAWSNKSTINQQNIADELGKWGSHSFALVYMYEAPTPPGALKSWYGQVPFTTAQLQAHTDPQTGAMTTSKTNPPPATGVFAAFNSLESAFSWLGGNWDRVLAVIGGAILVIIALFVLTKQQQTSLLKFAKAGEE